MPVDKICWVLIQWREMALVIWLKNKKENFLSLALLGLLIQELSIILLQASVLSTCTSDICFSQHLSAVLSTLTFLRALPGPAKHRILRSETSSPRHPLLSLICALALECSGRCNGIISSVVLSTTEKSVSILIHAHSVLFKSMQ